MRGRLRKKLFPCAKVRNRITSFETSFGVLRVGSGASRVRCISRKIILRILNKLVDLENRMVWEEAAITALLRNATRGYCILF
jgi:hypothetical protein